VRERVQNERGRALGIRGREERAHLPTVAGAEEHRLIRTDRIEYRANVLHVRLERGPRPWPVGCADAPPVEENQAREGGQPLAEVAEQWQQLPSEDRADHEGRPDQVS